MSSMGEAIYSIQPGRTLHNPPDLTPYSAVRLLNCCLVVCQQFYEPF